MPEHRWAAVVAFLHEGVPHLSGHYATLFGATASVHAWERIGALLPAIAIKVLRLPVFRYVDDFLQCR